MFKRANKELAKQSIATDTFDPEATEEVFAGVSSDESDDSDIEMKITQHNNKRKLLDHSDSEDDSEDDDDSDDDDSDAENDSDSDEQHPDKEGLDSDSEDEYETVYTCNICPDKRLTTEELVEEHMKSKSHLRRLRFTQKNLTKDTASPEEQKKRSEHQAQLKQKRQEKKRLHIKAKRLAKKARAYLKKNPGTAAAKEDTKKDEKAGTKDDKTTKDGKATTKGKKSKAGKKNKDVTTTKDSKLKDNTTATDNKPKAKKSKK